MELLRELEKASKGKETLDMERFEAIKAEWSSLAIDDDSELGRRFAKGEERVVARLKGEETQKKIVAFEAFIVELEGLKANTEVKLSERQNVLRRVRDGVKNSSSTVDNTSPNCVNASTP